MKQLTISITEEQEKFLKTFAETHNHNSTHDGSYCPIYAVQSKRYNVIPYSEDIAEFFDEENLAFTTDYDYDIWEKNEINLINNHYSYKECPIEIKPYEDIEATYFVGVDGEKRFIATYDDYFKSYGIELLAMGWRVHEYSNVAFFFIKDEAKKYLEYQAHNLTEPRIFSYGAGYGNSSEYHHFWELLMKMGVELNSETKVNAK